MIALAVAQAEEGAIGDAHALQLVLEKIGYGVLGGVLAGAVAAAVVVYAGGRRFVSAPWLQVVPLAGALLAFGFAEAIGGSGFIAAFVGGIVFGGLRRHRGGDVSYLMEQTGAVLAAVTFVVFGAVLLGPAIGDLTWQIALYAILSLTLVRMVPVAIAMLGTGARRPTVAFLGWFGPARRRLDRLRAPAARGGRAPERRRDPDDGVRHRRALRPRARGERRAARRPLRGLARRAGAADESPVESGEAESDVRWRLEHEPETS